MEETKDVVFFLVKYSVEIVMANAWYDPLYSNRSIPQSLQEFTKEHSAYCEHNFVDYMSRTNNAIKDVYMVGKYAEQRYTVDEAMGLAVN